MLAGDTQSNQNVSLDHLHFVPRRAGADATAKGQRAAARKVALLAAVAGFGVALAGIVVQLRKPLALRKQIETVANAAWIPSLGINYHLAADGISLTLVLLAGLAAIAGILFSWNIEHRVKEFFAFYLALIGGVYGVFLSFDLFLLFVFYEIAIIPKYFIIAIWGSTRKEYGAMKLVLYSFVGSAMVLVGLIAAYVVSGAHTFNVVELANIRSRSASRCGCSRWCSWASRFWRVFGRSTLGRPPATSPRRPPPRCCSPAW